MQYVIGSAFAVATVALAIGAISGRVKTRSCCAPADPSRDRRMQIGEAGSVTGSEAVASTPAESEGGSALAGHVP